MEGNPTIEGPGEDLLTIDGAGVARVLTVAPGVSLTLIDVTIAGGLASCLDPDGTTPPTMDQRGPGFPRRTNGDGVFGVQCDIGAIEVPEPGAEAGILAALALATLVRRRASRRS